MSREIELRRHTDADGDVLTDEGVSAALTIGARLRDGYQPRGLDRRPARDADGSPASSPQSASRCATASCVEPGLRSQVEDRWCAAYQKAGSGALIALRDADPELVAEDSERLGIALRRVLDALTDAARALVVGQGPTNEAAVLGLTGEIVVPLAEDAGVRVFASDDSFKVELLRVISCFLGDQSAPPLSRLSMTPPQ